MGERFSGGLSANLIMNWIDEYKAIPGIRSFTVYKSISKRSICMGTWLMEFKSRISACHSKNKNVLQILLDESDVKVACKKLSMAWEPESCFKTSKVTQQFIFRKARLGYPALFISYLAKTQKCPWTFYTQLENQNRIKTYVLLFTIFDKGKAWCESKCLTLVKLFTNHA